jgi:hypothetical protein
MLVHTRVFLRSNDKSSKAACGQFEALLLAFDEAQL